MTLVEIIIASAISAVIIFIVFSFIVDTLDSISYQNIRTESINDGFSFKNKFDRFYRGGFYNPSLVGSGTNDVILLQDEYGSGGVLFGIVDLNTMKLHNKYTYGDHSIGYRKVSEYEITQIEADNDVVYDMSFFADKVFGKMRVKNFSVDIYDGGNILDIFITSIISRTEVNFGESYLDFKIDKSNLLNFNLIF